ncbi:hypothetical protein [Microbulbifer discodermiae]|uniref:hypothetical protein n=1 Tax=Microbulbifer sp. 2201CG32-9 TaxID=3232309 RepID=UPI00345BDCD9
MKYLVLTFSVMSFAHTAHADDGCRTEEGLNEGSPLVQVAPKVGWGVKDGSCSVVSFKLIEKPGSVGKALIPAEIDIVSGSSRSLNKSVASAVSKWLYTAKAHDTETIYQHAYLYQK